MNARRWSIALAAVLAVASVACVGSERASPPATVTTVAVATSTTSSTSTTQSASPTTTTSTPPPSVIATPPETTAATTAPRVTATTVATTTSLATGAPDTPPSASRSVAVSRLPTDQPLIALTFDAGSDVGHTERVLDVLAAKGVVAGFGITGTFAEANPDHVRRMAREGHVVVNHSYSHFSFTGFSSGDVLLTATERQADLRRADDVLSPLIGRTTVPFWRPPFGDYDGGVLDDVGAIGYRYTLMWTIDSLGWRGLAVGDVVRRVLDLAEPGAIVLMHVGSESADAQALEEIIDGLRARGYTFTSIAVAFRP